MAILQKTLSYLGQGSVPPGVRLEFDIPVFKYTELHIPLTNNTPARTIIQREIVNRRKKEHVVQGLEYSIEVFAHEMIMDGNLALKRQYLLSQFASEDVINRINLEDISFVVPVQIFHNDISYGQQEIEVIDVISMRPAAKEPRGASLKDGFNQELFFVNKRSFARLVDQVNMGAFSTLLLGAIFHTIRSQTGAGIVLPQNEFVSSVNTFVRAQYETIAEAERAPLLAALPSLLKRIKEFDLNSLLDFPISIPPIEFEILHVGGTFTIDTNTPERVTSGSLDLYDLSIEYSTGREPKIVRVEWDRDTEFEGNQALPFAADIHEVVHGPITLSVKGLGTTMLWQKDFDPRQEPVDNILIRVPLMQPPTLRPSPSGAKERAKKLRGKLIQTGGHGRVLKGLTVLIQAKLEGDVLWRIVGSAETDRSGNFSMPYPYGPYSEAQALVSLSPDSPTPILMTDRENEAISDDFLFLLLAEDKLTKAPTEDECACHAPSLAQRLPDQEDLIESDEYTQDVGGACVNLTTPNRTLREYSHQAIVRFSDPEVTDYTLEKITDSQGNVRFRLNGGDSTIKRKIVGLDNPIRWQECT